MHNNLLKLTPIWIIIIAAAALSRERVEDEEERQGGQRGISILSSGRIINQGKKSVLNRLFLGFPVSGAETGWRTH